jgi:SAM-dependent methyltransferase
MSYDRAFFDYVNSGSLQSAQRLLPTLQAQLPVRSVLDVGCGAGAWLSAWRGLGIEDIVGLDGGYVDPSRLLIPRAAFRAVDLAEPFACGRRFDLVQSLEVAEHLPPSMSDRFVANLVEHGDVVLFSAAPPGQGGDHHVNEQAYGAWRRRFGAHGYQCIDYLRPRIAAVAGIEPWYRYNIFLYVHRAKLASLAAPLRAAIVPDSAELLDRSPLLYRCRKAAIRHLPVRVNTLLAKVKERVVLQWRRPAGGIVNE